MRRCALNTLKNATAVSERIFEADGGALPARRLELGGAGSDPRLPLPSELDQLAQLKRRFGATQPPMFACSQGFIELDIDVRIRDGAGLYAAASRDADVALGSRQSRVRRERALQGSRQHERAGGFRRRPKRREQNERCDERARDHGMETHSDDLN